MKKIIAAIIITLINHHGEMLHVSSTTQCHIPFPLKWFHREHALDPLQDAAVVNWTSSETITIVTHCPGGFSIFLQQKSSKIIARSNSRGGSRAQRETLGARIQFYKLCSQSPLQFYVQWTWEICPGGNFWEHTHIHGPPHTSAAFITTTLCFIYKTDESF